MCFSSQPQPLHNKALVLFGVLFYEDVNAYITSQVKMLGHLGPLKEKGEYGFVLFVTRF